MSLAEPTPPCDEEQPEPDAGSELSVVPLDKDSFGLCERCGSIGLRKNFYVRDSKYCSLYCFRSHRSKKRHFRFMLTSPADHLAGCIPMEPLPQLEHPWPADLHDIMRTHQPKSHQYISNSHEWKDELFGCDFLAAPVKLFKHAPLHDMWDATLEGMKVEVRNTDCDSNKRMSDYFWVATVLKVKGYMGLLRYEGFGSDDSKDFWTNLCCSDVHPVGWCATRGNPLIPPRSIEDKYSDWKKFLVKQLTGARTLPVDFYTKLDEGLRSRFTIGTIVEVVDKDRITQVKVASVCEIIGKRLHVKYYDSAAEDEGFWCHEDSPLIHPVGWAFRVGHPLDAPQHYCERVAAGRLLPNDATPNMFFMYSDTEPVRPLFREGMKLEAIDPLNLSSICAATVMCVLNHGYMMIRIDVYPADALNSDWFCYHQRSPCIFPVGFSAANNIKLKPPAGYTAETFSWAEYLAQCGAPAAGKELFAARSSVEHGFVAGMRLECADLMGPQLVCVATVARVVANLLKVHFDGWGEEYDQWLWGHSTDMYPVGWCRAVGHRLEGPLQPAPPPRPAPRHNKRAARRRNKNTANANSRPSSNAEGNSLPNAQNVKSNSPQESSPDHKSADITDSLDTFQPASEISRASNDSLNSAEQKSETEYEFMQPDGDSLIASSEDLNALLHSSNRLDELQMSNDNLDPPEQNCVNDSLEESNAKKEERKSLEEVVETKRTRLEIKAKAELKPETENEDSSKCESCKVIPRLVNNTSFAPPHDDSFDPESWSADDVSKFLSVNDCSPYCVNFGHVTGAAMLKLSKDDIIELLEMKVGPSLKIFDLIQQLKSKLKPQARMKFK